MTKINAMKIKEIPAIMCAKPIGENPTIAAPPYRGKKIIAKSTTLPESAAMLKKVALSVLTSRTSPEACLTNSFLSVKFNAPRTVDLHGAVVIYHLSLYGI
jgi:hypothetical protein